MEEAKIMPTYLRPHTGVKCPKMPQELLEQGYYLGVGICEKCEHKLEIRRPWSGFIVECALEGKSDSVTVEYG